MTVEQALFCAAVEVRFFPQDCRENAIRNNVECYSITRCIHESDDVLFLHGSRGGRRVSYDHFSSITQTAKQFQLEWLHEYGNVVPEAPVAGFARWRGKTGVIHGDGGRPRLNRAGHSDRLAA